MRSHHACMVVDLRSGEHVTNIPALIAVLSAAGWKTDLSLKEYGGETLQLARKAAKKKYDLVIGYGGDGTLNAVLNGVRYANGKSLVADVPGGTFNTWAGAIGVPNDPIKAVLAIVGSEAHKIDLGHVEVDGLSFPKGTSDHQQPGHSGKKQKKPARSAKTRHYFLMNVGIGIDAVMIGHVSKPLKYQVGPLAFDLAAMKELPKQRPFPVEVQQMDDKGNSITHWQGEVWQVYVSKLPVIGGSIDKEAGARADDGLLYVTLITANNMLKTIEQAFLMITQHKLDKEATQHFRGTRFSLRIPASIAMHVDGSVVKLDELLHTSERSALRHIADVDQVMVNYRFDAEPGAVRVAVPRTYDGPLFEKSPYKANASHRLLHQRDEHPSALQYTITESKKMPQDAQKQTQAQQSLAYKVSVIGAITYQEKQPILIVAGKYKQQEMKETQIVAVRVDARTQIFNNERERIPSKNILELSEGQEIVAEGHKTKRGVIRAVCVRVSG